jgi:hypothetical protein
VRPIFARLQSSNLTKNVAAAAPGCLQNVIASAAGCESLAGDSLDSDRIRVSETLAYALFPNFFSQAIPSASNASAKRSRRGSHVVQRLEEALSNC